MYAYLRWTWVEVQPLCVATAVPERPRSAGGVWYWIEPTPRECLLVRFDGKRTALARSPRIAAYWPSSKALAWIAADGKGWQVHRASPDGSGATTLFRSDHPLDGIWTDGMTTAWLEKLPPPKTTARFLPPIGPRTVVWMHDGRTSRKVAVLQEGFAQGQVVGAVRDTLYVAGSREDGIGVTVVYAIAHNSPPQRLLSEYGTISVALHGEELVWTAPSRESNTLLTACLRTMDLRNGVIRTAAEWLPAGGVLYRRGADWILCTGLTETAWQVDEVQKGGHPLSVPDDQWPIAADEHGLLAVQRQKTPGRVMVSRILYR